jgi:hypothetical protein
LHTIAQVLGDALDAEDDIDRGRRLAYLYDLFREVELIAESTAPGRTTARLRQLDLAFRLPIAQPWPDFAAFVTEAVLTDLDWLAREIGDDVVGYEVPSPDRLDPLRARLQELQSELRAPDIDVLLGAVLMRHVRAMRLAIDQFDLSGPAGLLYAIEASVGGAWAWNATKGHDRVSRRWWAKVLGAAVAGSALVGGAADGAELAKKISQVRAELENADRPAIEGRSHDKAVDVKDAIVIQDESSTIEPLAP